MVPYSAKTNKQINKQKINFFKKTPKAILTMYLNNHIPGHLFKRIENLCLHKNTYMKDHSNFIYNTQKMEMIKIST